MPHRSARAAPARRRAHHKRNDGERFHCPYPGCERSCAELWRLKVHYRAPANIRGSGVERGHGAELEFCPKCEERLEPGKHHFGCRSGLAAPRQAVHRRGDRKMPVKKRAGSKRLAARAKSIRRAPAGAQSPSSSELEAGSDASMPLIKDESPSDSPTSFLAADSVGKTAELLSSPSGIFSSRSHNSDLDSFSHFPLEPELDELLCCDNALSGVKAFEATDDIFAGVPLPDGFIPVTDVSAAPPLLSAAAPPPPLLMLSEGRWLHSFEDLEQHEQQYLQMLRNKVAAGC